MRKTQVMLGCFGIDRLDPRWPSARVLMAMLHQLHAGRLDPQHFARVRDRMVRCAAETYESTMAVAQQYAELESCGIDFECIDAHLDQLRALDIDRVHADAETLLDPASMHAAIVGRFDPDASVLGGLPRR